MSHRSLKALNDISLSKYPKADIIELPERLSQESFQEGAVPGHGQVDGGEAEPLTPETAYLLGRRDGMRSRRVRELSPGSVVPLRETMVALRSFLPEKGEPKEYYQRILRHYLDGVWQSVSLVWCERLPSSRHTPFAVEEKGLKAVGERLETERMQYIPVWEFRDSERVGDWVLERMAFRAERIARLMDSVRELSQEREGPKRSSR